MPPRWFLIGSSTATENVITLLYVQDSIKMSQLQNLLHDALIATEHVQQCAIVRRKDCLVRAASVGFNVGFKFSPASPHPLSLALSLLLFLI